MKTEGFGGRIHLKSGEVDCPRPRGRPGTACHTNADGDTVIDRGHLDPDVKTGDRDELVEVISIKEVAQGLLFTGGTFSGFKF